MQECCPESAHLSWLGIPSWDGPSIDHMALARSSEQLSDLHLSGQKMSNHTWSVSLHLVLNVTARMGT